MAEVNRDERGLFDKFAEAVANQVSRAWFFAACVILVLVWAPSLPLFGKVDTWQLVINTATTIVTFLMVALLQNSQRRSDIALQEKLNAVAEGVRDLMKHEMKHGNAEIRSDIEKLEDAVGLEERVGTK